MKYGELQAVGAQQTFCGTEPTTEQTEQQFWISVRVNAKR